MASRHLKRRSDGQEHWRASFAMVILPPQLFPDYFYTSSISPFFYSVYERIVLEYNLKAKHVADTLSHIAYSVSGSRYRSEEVQHHGHIRLLEPSSSHQPAQLWLRSLTASTKPCLARQLQKSIAALIVISFFFCRFLPLSSLPLNWCSGLSFPSLPFTDTFPLHLSQFL